MCKKYYLILLFLSLKLVCNSQTFNTYWLWGREHFIWGNMADTNIVFDYITDSTGFRNYDIVFNLSCISNEFGHPVLFTNGRDIINDSGKIIDGGRGIMDSMINDVVSYGLEMSQSSIILPRLNNQYYVIYMSQDDDISRAGDQKPNYLYYALVDMNANGGKGKVDRKKYPSSATIL